MPRTHSKKIVAVSAQATGEFQQLQGDAQVATVNKQGGHCDDKKKKKNSRKRPNETVEKGNELPEKASKRFSEADKGLDENNRPSTSGRGRPKGSTGKKASVTFPEEGRVMKMTVERASEVQSEEELDYEHEFIDEDDREIRSTSTSDSDQDSSETEGEAEQANEEESESDPPPVDVANLTSEEIDQRVKEKIRELEYLVKKKGLSESAQQLSRSFGESNQLNESDSQQNSNDNCRPGSM